jgi:hypothetical protein
MANASLFARASSAPFMLRMAGVTLGLIVGVAAIAYGLGINPLFLPDCGSDAAVDVLQSIFKDKDVDVERITDPATVTDTNVEKTCKAHVEARREQANIGYKVYWDGWSAKVVITRIEATPIRGASGVADNRPM